jgi:RNA polymerase sigma-70 factor (ECF subfamily)
MFADEPSSCVADHPESALILKEQSKDVWNAVETLPPIYRAPIILHYFARLSQDEAASVLQISGGTCRSRLSRGRAMLGKVLCCEVH